MGDASQTPYGVRAAWKKSGKRTCVSEREDRAGTSGGAEVGEVTRMSLAGVGCDVNRLLTTHGDYGETTSYVDLRGHLLALQLTAGTCV